MKKHAHANLTILLYLNTDLKEINIVQKMPMTIPPPYRPSHDI